ncbi:MAG: tetratricopeptide repeat protein [Desulfovermiculus sp.]|nr:tetratricopeptide repeat protein [Desulfovermiculus sp.]
MQDKIAWYEEVLAQDPGSPLFFNLARLYLDQGERDKAIDYLQAGLDRNPAHAQARFLLIQSLADADRRDTARQYVEPILAGLGSSPDFWLLWAEKLEDEGRTDLAVAVRFIGMDMAQGPMFWTHVLLQGLQDPAKDTKRRFSVDQIEEPRIGAGEDVSAGTDPNTLEDQEEHEEGDWDEHLGTSSAQELNGAEEDLPSGGYRTVTMADILAGQGEFEAALEIYAQLQAAETDPERRQKITDRMDSVFRRMAPGEEKETGGEGFQESPEVDVQDALSPDMGDNGQETTKAYARGQDPKKQELLRRLDRLASRLEAKG